MSPLLFSAFCLSVVLLVTPECHAQINQRFAVHTHLGDISGLVTPTRPGGPLLYQFLGIPYAEPPLGPLRFRKPVPVPPWSNTLNAMEFGPACPQGNGAGRGLSEDCLYLNVYVSADDSLSATGPGKAVMVWIHGGGFVVGSGSVTDGSRMAVTGDVVVVTINYRLGMLGWLSTLDDASPGNYGLWDQQLAVMWVRDNIVAFGGDPNKITLFGDSAGGYSTGLHTVSPLNNGLFQRAIMMSGNALSRRTIALDPVGFARRFGENLRCLKRTPDGFDSNYLVECARQRPVRDILRATQAAFQLDFLAWRLNVAPVVDGEFLPADVRSLLGPDYNESIPFWGVDVMVGTTNGEGSLVFNPLIPFQEKLGIDLSNGIPTTALCGNISAALARDYFPHRISENVSRALCEEYTSQVGDDAAQGRQVVNLYGDMMFVSSAVETLQRHANRTGQQRNRYQYLFSYAPRGSSRFPWFQGAGHYSDVRLVFGAPLRPGREQWLSRAIMTGWTNFAKYGTPNDSQNPGNYRWPRYDLHDMAYTNLNLQVTSARNIYPRRMQFWLRTIPNIGNGATFWISTPQVSPHWSDNTTWAGNSTNMAATIDRPGGNVVGPILSLLLSMGFFVTA